MTDALPTFADRLRHLKDDALRYRLELAQTSFRYAKTAYSREEHMRDIADIKAEMTRRGLPVHG